MGINTKSSFFYGYEVTDENNLIAIDEGGGRVDSLLVNGAYTLAQYVDMVSTVLNNAYGFTYAVTVNRVTRIINITSTSATTLLVGDITAGASGFPLLGFTGGNLTNVVFNADSQTGSEYRPQFKLQRYVDADYNKEYENAKVVVIPTGNKKEIINFGFVGFYEFIIDWVCDAEFKVGSPIESNPTGISDVTEFLIWCTAGKPLEFIRDRNTPSSFRNILIEKTSKSSTGSGFKLREKSGLQGYFDTGLLTFRDIT